MPDQNLIPNDEQLKIVAQQIIEYRKEGFNLGRQVLVDMYHNIGQAILSLPQRYSAVQDLARLTGLSERTLYYSAQFAEKFPDANNLPEGKNTSWTKLVDKYLPVRREDLPSPETIVLAPQGVEQLIFSSIQVKEIKGKKVVEIYFNDEKFMWVPSAVKLEDLRVKMGWSLPQDNKCPNPKGHADCVEYINSVGKKFPNYAKQIHFLHKILETGFTFEQMNKSMDELDKDKFYQGSWDFATLSNYLGKQYVQPN